MIKQPKEIINELIKLFEHKPHTSNNEAVGIQKIHYEVYKFTNEHKTILIDGLRALSLLLNKETSSDELLFYELPIDEPTNIELYIGRMAVELMKQKKEVLISEAGISSDNLRFTINPFDTRVCLEKSRKEFQLMEAPLDAANYDSGDMLDYSREM